MKTEFQRRSELLLSENYDPKALIDHLKELLDTKTDANFCKAVGIHPTMLSKVRTKRNAIGAEMLLAFHDVTGVSIKEMKQLMGDVSLQKG